MADLSLPRPPFHVVLVEPQIPPNTGNVARLCSVTGCHLHLVGPLGFSIADKEMRRAGLDYWFALRRTLYADLAEFLASLPSDARLHLFTARAARPFWDIRFAAGDYLVFGSEPKGLPTAFLQERQDQTLAIPMLPETRSLNLATAVGIGVYEALRQLSADKSTASGESRCDKAGN
ncbi:MAG: tRNA (cytidine(34)-2'-O)-methyltransferase [Deltaproteobacteria bacterium]